MNSLVSATKVVTNDAIPNPIVSSLNTISLPSIPVPVSSIGIPVMSMKIGNSEPEKPIEIENMEAKPVIEMIDADDEKELKKSVEPMPVEEEEGSLGMAAKSEENLCETDIEVTDADPRKRASEDQDKENVNNCSAENLMSASEPMECASVNSFASPKHTMATDVIMAESVSVRPNICEITPYLMLMDVSDLVEWKHASRELRHVTDIKL